MGDGNSEGKEANWGLEEREREERTEGGEEGG